MTRLTVFMSALSVKRAFQPSYARFPRLLISKLRRQESLFTAMVGLDNLPSPALLSPDDKKAMESPGIRKRPVENTKIRLGLESGVETGRLSVNLRRNFFE